MKEAPQIFQTAASANAGPKGGTPHPERPRPPASGEEHSRTRAKLALALATLLALAAAASAAAPFNQPLAVTSRSGQFIVYRPSPSVADTDPPHALTATGEIQLEQGTLAITCDRIRTVLLQELGAVDLAPGKIYIHLKPAGPDAEIMLKPLRFSTGWQYQLWLPTRLERTRLVTAITHTLLQELANRHAGARPANVPQWLVEGLTTQVLIAGGPALVPEPRRVLVVDVTPRDHFTQARDLLRRHGALSFSDLNMPSPSQLSGPGWAAHQASSQIFIASLLRLNRGNQCLLQFTRELGNFLNPQLAFMKAFGEHFQSALEVEKWWSATALNFTGRDHRMNWTQAVSLQRLDEILQTPLEIQNAAGQPARRQSARLQDGLRQLDFAQQRQLFTGTLRHLEILQGNAPPDLSRLVIDYRDTLANYLQERGRADIRSDLRNRITGAHAAIMEATVRQLDLLDVIREDFRKTGEVEAANAAAKR